MKALTASKDLLLALNLPVGFLGELGDMALGFLDRDRAGLRWCGRRKHRRLAYSFQAHQLGTESLALPGNSFGLKYALGYLGLSRQFTWRGFSFLLSYPDLLLLCFFRAGRQQVDVLVVRAPLLRAAERASLDARLGHLDDFRQPLDLPESLLLGGRRHEVELVVEQGRAPLLQLLFVAPQLELASAAALLHELLELLGVEVRAVPLARLCLFGLLKLLHHAHLRQLVK